MLKKQRVLYVLSGTFSPLGGMYEYLRAWLAHSKDSISCAAVAAPPLVCNELREGHEVFPLRSGTASTDTYKRLVISKTFGTSALRGFCRSLKSAADQFSPDIIHLLDISLYADSMISFLSRHAASPSIYLTLHDPDLRKESGGLAAGLLRKRLYGRLIAAAGSDRRFSLHVHDLRLTEGLGFPGEVKFVEMPHPLPGRMATRARPSWSGGASQRFRIGFLGRITPYKGLDDLYAAFKWCIAQQSFEPEKIELLVAGSGKFDEGTWQRLPMKTTILNYLLEEKEFHQRVADLDLLILPYRRASQSGVAAMGVSYGVPILATNAGALDRLVIDGENGFLVEPKKPIALGKKLIEIVTDERLYSDMLVRARRHLPKACRDTEER